MCSKVGSPRFFQDFLIGMHTGYLDLHHLIDQSGKTGSLGATQEQFTALQMLIGIVKHRQQAGFGEIARHFRLLIVGKSGKFPPRFLKTSQ